MSDNTAGGVYCSVCHKRRPSTHFEDRPDHAAGGPKFTLAERRELGEDLDGYSSTPRPRRPRSTPPASDAGEGEGGGGWIVAGIGAAVLAGLGYLAWLGRNANGGGLGPGA